MDKSETSSDKKEDNGKKIKQVKKKKTAEVITNSESHKQHRIHHCIANGPVCGCWNFFAFNQPSILGNVPLLSVASPSLLVPALSLYSRHFL